MIPTDNKIPERPYPMAKKLFWGTLFAALLLVNFTVFFSLDSIPLHTKLRFLYQFDFRHWPTWYAVNLWIIAIAAVAELLLRVPKYQIRFNEEIRHLRNRNIAQEYEPNRYTSIIVKSTVILVLIVSLYCLCFLEGFIYTLQVYVFEPYYFLPLIDLFHTAKVSWRLFIAPSTGLIAIILLLRWNHSMKKRRAAA